MNPDRRAEVRTRHLTTRQHLVISGGYLIDGIKNWTPTSLRGFLGRGLLAGGLGGGVIAASEIAQIFSQGRPAIVAEASPNLAEICRVGFRLRIAEYLETNGKEFYQDGEDQIAATTKNARLTFQVASRDVKAIVNNKPVDAVVTDNNGGAEFNISPVECNGADGKSADVITTITTAEKRVYAKVITAENSKRQPLAIWLRREAVASTPTTAGPTVTTSPTPTGTPDRISAPGATATATTGPNTRPAASPTPAAARTPEAGPVSPAQGPSLQQMLSNLANDMIALFGGVDKIVGAAEPQVVRKQAVAALEKANEALKAIGNRASELERQAADFKESKEVLEKDKAQLKEQITQLEKELNQSTGELGKSEEEQKKIENELKTLKETQTRLEQESENKGKLAGGLAGALGLVGVVGGVVGWLWRRERGRRGQAVAERDQAVIERDEQTQARVDADVRANTEIEARENAEREVQELAGQLTQVEAERARLVQEVEQARQGERVDRNPVAPEDGEAVS